MANSLLVDKKTKREKLHYGVASKKLQFLQNKKRTTPSRHHSSQGKSCCWLLDASTYRISLAFSYNGCRFSRIADEACQELLYCASWEDNSWLKLPILSEYIPLLSRILGKNVRVFQFWLDSERWAEGIPLCSIKNKQIENVPKYMP